MKENDEKKRFNSIEAMKKKTFENDFFSVVSSP